VGILFALLLAVSPQARAQGAQCMIVYGQNWAFMLQVPDGWNAACGKDAMKQTAITLWPSAEKRDQLDAIMYVTVSEKGHDTLASFVAADMATYKVGDPDSEKMDVASKEQISPTRILFHIRHATGDRDELVEYIQGPTAYFIVVLTTESSAMTKMYRPAFTEITKSFVAMTLNHSGS
jgi:hypothetical protein